jgi:hypothetical protein
MIRALVEASGCYEGDYPQAGIYLRVLVSYGALIEEPGEDGTTTYRKASRFPDIPQDTRTALEKQNAELQAFHQENVRRLKREGDQRQQHAEFLSGMNNVSAQVGFRRSLAQAGIDPQNIQTRLAAIEAAIHRIERQIAGDDTDALIGAQEVVL